jgi:hypothetical protein
MTAATPTWPLPADDLWPVEAFPATPPPIVYPRGVRPARRPKRRQEPDPVRGVALHFGRAFKANIGPKRRTICFAPGSLDASLAKIAAGRAPFSLWFGHDRHDALILADESRGCLKVWRDGDKLRLLIVPTTRAAREAIRRIRASGARQLSVGVNRVSGTAHRVEGSGRLFLIKRGVLREISVTPVGAAGPDCRLSL